MRRAGDSPGAGRREARAKRPAVDYIAQSWLGTPNNSSSLLLDAMPASLTLLQLCLVAWTALLQWAGSVPVERRADCPGYKASNVKKTESALTADLTLAGPECNIYGNDLHDLKFVAEYESGSYASSSAGVGIRLDPSSRAGQVTGI